MDCEKSDSLNKVIILFTFLDQEIFPIEEVSGRDQKGFIGFFFDDAVEFLQLNLVKLTRFKYAFMCFEFLRDDRSDGIENLFKIIAFARFKTQRDNRVLSLVLLKNRTLSDVQTLKKLPVFFHVFIRKKVVQHTHVKCFAKPPRAGKENNR